MNNKILLILILSIVLSTASFGQETMDPLQSELYSMGFGIPRQPLPSIDFTLKDLKGNEVTLSSLTGKIVFLNFWATWCGPCRSEMPSMEKLQSLMKNKDFEILAVASLQGDSMDSITTYISRNKLTFPVLIDPDGSLGGAYSVQGIPTTYIIGKDGNIIARLVGAFDWADDDVVEVLTRLAER